MSSPDFSGRVVLVTGGTKGIGLGIAERFAAAGAQVVVCARHEVDPAVLPAGSHALTCDVRDAEAVAGMVDGIVARHRHLDVVVNNAGGSPPADAASASPRFSAAIVTLNLVAPLYVAQAANRVMQPQPDGGSIVNIASVSGLRPSPGTAAYGAAKAGLINLTASLAVEWAPKVRVNAVSAGLVRTEQSDLHYGDEQSVAAVAATVPAGRLAEPADIADACLFLASSHAAYISGTNLVVHGGGERPAFLAAVEEAGGRA